MKARTGGGNSDVRRTQWEKHHGDSLEGQIGEDMVRHTKKPR